MREFYIRFKICRADENFAKFKEQFNMKKSILCIIVFLFGMLFYFNCNGDLLEEGPETNTPTSLDVKHRGIWLIGGLAGDGTTNGITTTISAIDVYDPVTNNMYLAITSLPTPVSFAAVASANGKIYVIGGFQSNGTVATLNQIYDVANDTWSSGSTASFTASANMYASVSDNRIYILGGTTGNASAAWTAVIAASATQCYNISSDSWITGLTAFGTVGSERLAMSYNGIVYNMGGRTSAAGFVTTHDGYTCGSNSLTSAAETALSSARNGMAGSIYRYSDGYIAAFIVGGATVITGCSSNYIFQNTLSNYTTTNLFQYMYYSPVLSVWSTGANLPTSTAFGAAAISGTTLYYFGGSSSGTGTSLTTPLGITSVYSLNISTRGSYGSWTTITPNLNTTRARFGHAAVTINQ
jgi:N-acetylneuraminic acid mutarotase